MKPQLDRSRPIPDTTVFDVRLSHRHYYAPMTTGMGLITFEGA